VAGGILRPGDDVVVLPGGKSTTIAAIDSYEGPLEEAFPPMSVTVRLSDDLDVSRGDLLSGPDNQPHVGQALEAMVCWMAERPLTAGDRYRVEHTTRSARAVVRDLLYRLDVNTLEREQGIEHLAMNDIGRVTLRAAAPLAFDEYSRNRTTGSFILIDEATNATAGAGMILGPAA
jgi:sulfate adenylyltransferase subunit 1 (EFTu-like GTPase family)